jgi:hypothetical protein
MRPNNLKYPKAHKGGRLNPGIKLDNLYLGDDFSEQLSSMKSFQFQKKPTNLVFNLDTILEKISSDGINSLTVEEKNYLYSLNK